jgi:hypothetical protein
MDDTKKIILACLLLAVVAVASSFAVAKLFFQESYLERSTLDYAYTVKERTVGINLDANKLNFGGGPAGAILSRGVNISASTPGEIHLSWVGNGTLSVDYNNFILDAGESQEVLFTVFIPETQEIGNYSGQIYVDVFEVK